MADVRPRIDEDRLIAEQIDQSWGIADARLVCTGVSVWALIGYLRATGDDVERARQAHDLTPEAIDAALAYYRRYKELINARLLLNATP